MRRWVPALLLHHLNPISLHYFFNKTLGHKLLHKLTQSILGFVVTPKGSFQLSLPLALSSKLAGLQFSLYLQWIYWSPNCLLRQTRIFENILRLPLHTLMQIKFLWEKIRSYLFHSLLLPPDKMSGPYSAAGLGTMVCFSERHLCFKSWAPGGERAIAWGPPSLPFRTW